MNNKFIILIGSYNNEKWVSSNIESVLCQTHTNFKIVYYNAASTDKTYEIAKTYADKDRRINLIQTEERNLKTWFFEHASDWEVILDNDIVCILDGDDFLSSEEVLYYLNEVYDKTNCWMTYGGMLVWDGEKTTEPFPQNSVPPLRIFKEKLYRQDLWRYSHMRTCRGFLWKRLNKSDLKSSYDNNYLSMCDLCTVYPFLEMCPSNKIFRVEQPIYLLNVTKDNGSRSFQELQANNLGKIYETEIRNRPKYPELSVVSSILAGGLGNQMFEIAAAASLAKDNNALLLINPSEHILPNQGRNINTYLNNVFSKIATDNSPPTKTSYSWDHFIYKPIPYQPNIKLGGHFQSFKYFDHNKEYIQNLFSPDANAKGDIHNHYDIENILNDITAIQVRRGDYYKFPDHHPLLPIEYYIKAVETINPKEVWIFSDDIDWCKENITLDCSMRYIKEEDYIEMYLISFCKNVIMSNSSFGWWAAYLKQTEGKIIAPKNWLGNAYIKEGFKIEDLIPPNWILI